MTSTSPFRQSARGNCTEWQVRLRLRGSASRVGLSRGPTSDALDYREWRSLKASAGMITREGLPCGINNSFAEPAIWPDSGE